MLFAGSFSGNYAICSAGLGLVCSALMQSGTEAVIDKLLPSESQSYEFSPLRNEFELRERLYNKKR